MTRILLLGRNGRLGWERERFTAYAFDGSKHVPCAEDVAPKLGVYGRKKLPTDTICPITTRKYSLSGRRPASSRLATAKLRGEFRVELPHWHTHRKQFLGKVAAKETA